MSSDDSKDVGRLDSRDVGLEMGRPTTSITVVVEKRDAKCGTQVGNGNLEMVRTQNVKSQGLDVRVEGEKDGQ